MLFASEVPTPIVNLSLIVAVSENQVIGRKGELPWRLSADLKRFKRLTMGHSIIMGRKTFDSIGRCLPGRRMIVISRQPSSDLMRSAESSSHSLLLVSDLISAIKLCNVNDESFIIGGGQIYRQALPLIRKIYLTRVHTTIDDGDTFFPGADLQKWTRTRLEHHMADSRNNFAFSFEDYEIKSEYLTTLARRWDAESSLK